MHGILAIYGVEKIIDEVEEGRNCSQYSTSKQADMSRTPLRASLFQLENQSVLLSCHFAQAPILPRLPPMKVQSDLIALDLDRCTFSSLFPRDRPSTIAIIGNSLFGILVCRNLYETSRAGERELTILSSDGVRFKYGKYRDDGIFFDNTGLKGVTADWARCAMERDITDPFSSRSNSPTKSRSGDSTYLSVHT